MRARLLALGLVGGLAVAAAPALAAKVVPAPTPQVVDPAGDANGLNDQLLGKPLPNPNQSTAPASYSSADITSVLFQTAYVKKGRKQVPAGFTATLTLAGAPDANTFYDVDVSTPVCPDTLQFQYSTFNQFETNVVTCYDGNNFNDYAVPPATISGNTITWTVPLAAVPAGTVFSSISAYTGQGPFGVAFVTDEADPSASTYTVGK